MNTRASKYVCKKKVNLLELKFNESENSRNNFITYEYLFDLMFQVGVSPAFFEVVKAFLTKISNKPFVDFSSFLRLINLFEEETSEKAVFRLFSNEENEIEKFLSN